MSKLKLTYFDFHGGRGEAIRLALAIGGIEFEDFRFPMSDFAEVVGPTPFAQVPTLEIDGQVITQTNAINRYVAKQADLYPTDDLQALMCDEVMDAAEDFLHKIVPTFRMEGEEQKAARQGIIDGPLSKFLLWAEARLSSQGGEFFADNRLTIADLKVFVMVNSLNSGNLDHIPADLVERLAPSLNAHNQRIKETSAVVAYYSNK